MATIQDLPHLIALLDDDSPVVREAVTSALFSFGDQLPGMLDELPTPPNPSQQACLRLILGDYLRRQLRDQWPNWLTLTGEAQRLEAAQTLIAEFQNGPAYATDLKTALDGIAAQFAAKYGQRDLHVLVRFLFEELGFSGERKNYNHPQNSNLLRVIESRRGLPISLACVFMLVAHRLGMDVRGVNWPDHFLTRASVNGKEFIFDGYQGGPGIERESFLKMQGPSREAAEAILNQPCDAVTIMVRVLRNLVRAYEHDGQDENSALMLTLLQQLEQRAERR
jgi:hypothetical protein